MIASFICRLLIHLDTKHKIIFKNTLLTSEQSKVKTSRFRWTNKTIQSCSEESQVKTTSVYSPDHNHEYDVPNTGVNLQTDNEKSPDWHNNHQSNDMVDWNSLVIGGQHS